MSGILDGARKVRGPNEGEVEQILPLNARKARVLVTVHDNALAALSAGSACGKSG